MLTRKSKLVSAIVPCYNQGRYLGEAIESILNQTYPHFEIIVIDDGSNDNTSAVAARFPEARLIRKNNEGLSAARNAGLEVSSGAYVVFLDADDRLLPEAFELSVGCLEAYAECAFAYGHVRLVDDCGSVLPTPQQVSVNAEHYFELLRHNFIWTPGAVMYRRSVLDSVGNFDPRVNASADLDLNLRIARHYPARCLDKVVLEYRKHDSNMSTKFEEMLKSAMAVLRSQRKYIKGNRRFEQALESSIKLTRQYYGEKIVNRLRENAEARQWNKAIASSLALLKHYPQGLLKHASRKFFRNVLDARN